MQNYITRQQFAEVFSFTWEGKRSRSKLETLFEWAGEQYQPSHPFRPWVHLTLDRVPAKLHSKSRNPAYGQFLRARRGSREQGRNVETTIKKQTNKDGVEFSLNCQFKLEM